MRPYLATQARTGRSGVVAIGIAQEFQNVFASSKRVGNNGVPWFSFTKADRRVTCFYFYVWDVDFGPAFIKICSYFPYPTKVWLNGHEWAKRQAAVVNTPDDLRCQRRLVHLDELQTRARDVNRRLLDTERVGQGCLLASPAFERIARPTLTEDGRRAPALRFGDPRVQALAGALCTTVLAVTGVTNKSLRALMTGLLSDTNYSMNQASYDLARLRLNGLITRIPGRNFYRLTSDGLRFAIFYTKVHDRLLRPLLAADTPPAPPDLRNALHTTNIHVQDPIDHARLLPHAA